jgi:tetratricopeptide (TPR) repeat protein
MALATAYRMNKEPEKELDQLAKAVASAPRDYDLRMVYGRGLRDGHKLVPASAQFLAAAQIKPDSVEAWNELASALINSENYAQGLAALDHIKAMGKETPGDLFFRAITLDKLRQLKPALAAYEQFLAADKGTHPDQEFQARQRARIINVELNKR